MSAIFRQTTLRRAVLVAITASAVAGCTSHTKRPEPSLSPVVTATAPALPTSAAPASSSAAAEPVLPRGCSQLLPLATVQQALGAVVRGQVTYLKAAPVPQSGRTGRVTCGYGAPVSSPTGSPIVEASYITYVDAKTAASRVALTVQTDGANSSIYKMTVAGKPAAALLGPQWNELVMADGARTIVVEVSPTVLPAAKAPGALAVMAEAMLKFGSPATSSSGPAAAASS